MLEERHFKLPLYPGTLIVVISMGRIAHDFA